MKAYLSFLKLRFNVGMQYRIAAVAGIFTQFFFGLMYIFIYEAYYRTGVSVSMEWEQLVTYLWISQAFFYLTYFNLVDGDIVESLVSGQIAYELVRPISIYWMWYMRLFAKKISGTALRFLPVIIIASVLPTTYSLKAPPSIEAFILFIITLFLGCILSLAIIMVVYSLMFYTTSSKGLIHIYGIIADFFAGGIIPIPIMPQAIQNICYALPFRLIIDLPFRTYSGSIATNEAIQGIGLQIIWTIIIVFIGMTIISNAKKRLVVQGG